MSHLTFADLRKVDQMDELSVEETVADFERDFESRFVRGHNIGRIIDSWRERGEALKDIAKFSPSARARRTAGRALKDKP